MSKFGNQEYQNQLVEKLQTWGNAQHRNNLGFELVQPQNCWNAKRQHQHAQTPKHSMEIRQMLQSDARPHINVEARRTLHNRLDKMNTAGSNSKLGMDAPHKSNAKNGMKYIQHTTMKIKSTQSEMHNICMRQWIHTTWAVNPCWTWAVNPCSSESMHSELVLNPRV